MGLDKVGPKNHSRSKGDKHGKVAQGVVLELKGLGRVKDAQESADQDQPDKKRAAGSGEDKIGPDNPGKDQGDPAPAKNLLG
jgi:hypothetical protein